MSKRAGWTAEHSRLCGERTRRVRPWAASTGPKSAAGKKRSSQNALKHGRYSKDAIAFRRAATRWLRKIDRLITEAEGG